MRKGEVLTILLVVALVVATPFIGYQVYKYFAPRYESVRRDVYDESRAYQQGTMRDLENLRIKYVEAETDEVRDVLRSTILHRVADFPEDKLSREVRGFINELKREAVQ